MTGAYELINAAVSESEKIGEDRPVARIKGIIGEIQKYLDDPLTIPSIFSCPVDSAGQLTPLMIQLAENAAITPEAKYDFKNNYLISLFIYRFNDFAYFICNRLGTLKDRGQEFNDGVIKIFAQSAGDFFGTFYIEEETLGRLTTTMTTLDDWLGEGITH
jgi:hypothetical protein